MDTRIEKNLVLGLARIFSAYGWKSETAPTRLSDQLTSLTYGLYHGEAKEYLTHIKDIITLREIDNNWGIFTPLFVNGIATLLTNYAEHNDLFIIEQKGDTPVFRASLPKTNIFKFSFASVIERLREHSKTVINYQLIEEYGKEKVLADLKEYFPKAKLKIKLEEHIPDQLRDWIYDDGVRKMTVYSALMPIVVVSRE